MLFNFIKSLLPEKSPKSEIVYMLKCEINKGNFSFSRGLISFIVEINNYQFQIGTASVKIFSNAPDYDQYVSRFYDMNLYDYAKDRYDNTEKSKLELELQECVRELKNVQNTK